MQYLQEMEDILNKNKTGQVYGLIIQVKFWE